MPALRGEQHYAHRLTETDVTEIRASYIPGLVSQKALATLFGVTQSTVADVIARRSWSHLQ